MSHAPKTAALIAYDAGALSAKGKARLERHLASCWTCREELAKARLWTRESARIRALSDRPPVDFAKMELSIAREAASEARHRRAERSPGLAIPALAVAAIAVLSLGLSRLSGPIVRPAGPPDAAPLALAAPFVAGEARVMLAAGDVRIGRGSERRAAVAGEAIALGESVTVDGGELHLRLADGTGLAMLADASEAPAGFSLLGAEGGLVVRHDGGRLVAEVAIAPSRAEAPTIAEHGSSVFVVLAASYRIEARVARFVVDLDAPSGEIAVAVESGRLELVEGDRRTVLEAPAAWPPGSERVDGAAPQVAGLTAEASAWPVLSAIGEGIVRWQLGETTAAGGPALSVAAPPGEHELVGWDASGAAFRALVVLGPGGLRLEGEDLVPDAPRVRDGYLSRGILNTIVTASAGRLEHCYQQALRLRALSGDVMARVRLSPRGVVMSVRILSEDAPPSLERCVMAEAERWEFPPPGGPMSFDVPLSFRSR